MVKNEAILGVLVTNSVLKTLITKNSYNFITMTHVHHMNSAGSETFTVHVPHMCTSYINNGHQNLHTIQWFLEDSLFLEK